MTTRRPWYKRFPADFFDGCVSLSFEERGAYSLVLDLIYMHGGPIPDNDRYISGMLSLSVRAWRNLRDRLVEMGKLTLAEGHISNRRADAEIAAATAVAQTRALAGAAGGTAKAANAKLSRDNPEIILTSPADKIGVKCDKPLKTHDPTIANASSLLAYARAGLESESEKVLASSSKGELEARPKSRRRIKYPDDFEAFWKSYPTDPNMSKLEASQAWAKLDDDERKAAIESIPGFLAFCGKDRTYRPIHANRYLLKRRFEGHLETGKAMSQRREIHPGTAAWDAWRSHYRDIGKNFAVALMDERQRERRTFTVPADWPPGHRSEVAA